MQCFTTFSSEQVFDFSQVHLLFCWVHYEFNCCLVWKRLSSHIFFVQLFQAVKLFLGHRWHGTRKPMLCEHSNWQDSIKIQQHQGWNGFLLTKLKWKRKWKRNQNWDWKCSGKVNTSVKRVPLALMDCVFRQSERDFRTSKERTADTGFRSSRDRPLMCQLMPNSCGLKLPWESVA